MTTRFCIRCGEGFSGNDELCRSCGSESPPTPVSGREFAEADAIPEVWEPGDRLLDLYEVKGVLGEGGMGTVYRVGHLGWGLDLAVKSPKPETLAGADGLEAFVDEAGTWVELGLHPHVVTCHFVRTLGSIPRVFAELVEGQSLKQHIADDGLYPGDSGVVLTRLLDIAIQFAWGLGYAHDKGLIHQDVKPGNLMLDVDTTAKVTDFGLARGRAPDLQGSAGTRVVHGVGGTPAYYSPEQADAVAEASVGTPLDERTWLTRRTDVWSWAVSVLEMFLGERTWERGNAASLSFDEYVAQGASAGRGPPMPPGLVELLRLCFHLDPDRRPSGFDDVADWLLSVYREVVGQSYPRPVPRPADMVAASLTNRAVSMLELGRLDAAETTFLQAQTKDPDLPELVYDKALADWHAGRISDLQAVDRVANCAEGRPGVWRPTELLALLHTERRDRRAALEVLGDAASSGPDQAAVAQLTAEIEAASGSWAGQVGAVEDKAEPLADVIISSAGHTVVTCGSERRAITIDSAGAGGVVQVIDGSEGSIRDQRALPYGRLTSAAFGPDERSFFAASLDAGVLEFPTNAPLAPTWQAKLPGRGVSDLVVSDNGLHLLAVHNKPSYMGAGIVTMWDLGTRGVVRELSERGLTLSGIAASEGLVVAGGSPWTGRGDFLILVWELESGRLVHRLGDGLAIGGAAQCMAFLADGGQLVSGHAGGEVLIWDLETGECVGSLTGHTEAVQAITPHPLRPLVVSASEDHTIRIWDPARAVCLRTLEGHEDGLRGIGLSADGTRLVSGSRDGDVRLWDLTELPSTPRRWAICRISSATEAASVRARFDDAALAARRSIEAERWADAAANARRARYLPGMERHRDSLALWSEVAHHGRPTSLRSAWTSTELPAHSNSTTSVALDQGGQLAVSGGTDGLIKIWDLHGGQAVLTLTGHEGAVAAVALLPGGDAVASGGFDGSWRLWSLDDPRRHRVLHDGRRTVGVVAATPDGRYLVAGESGTVRKPVIRVHDLMLDKTFTLGSHKHMGIITGAAPTPDGRCVLVGEINLTSKPAGYDLHGILRLFDLDARECVKVFDAADFPPVALAVVPDGRRAVTVTWGRTVVVWDLTDREPVDKIEDLRHGMPELYDRRSVSVRGDGAFALNGCDDGRLRLWDLERSQLVRELEAHPDDVSSIAMSSDASVVVSGGDDGNLRVWGLEWDFDFPDAAAVPRAAIPHLDALGVLAHRSGVAADATWFQERLGDVGFGWIKRDAIGRWLNDRWTR